VVALTQLGITNQQLIATVLMMQIRQSPRIVVAQHDATITPNADPEQKPLTGYEESQVIAAMHQATPAPAPAEERKPEPVEEVVKEVVVQDDAMLKKIEALQALIKQQDDERIAREQAIVAAAAAKKAKEEQEALQSAEVAAASAAAKAAAEKAAEEAAKAAKEESDKKLAEAEAAKAELEKKQKELEEAVAKAAAVPDMLKPPIKFKDAVGRKFSFPWHLCKTWKGMEVLIKQAFQHVDVIGAHVQEGHYDLMGPEGEIILPQVWETMIKPDWEVSMHMWPIPELLPKKEKKEKKEEKSDEAFDNFMAQQFAQMSLNQVVDVPPPALVEQPKKTEEKKDIKKAKRNSVPAAAAVVAGPSTIPQSEMPAFNTREEWEHWMATGEPPAVVVDPVVVVPEAPPKPPKAKSKPKKISGIAAWMAGAQPPKKDDEKLEMSASNNRNSNNRSHSPPRNLSTSSPSPVVTLSRSAGEARLSPLGSRSLLRRRRPRRSLPLRSRPRVLSCKPHNMHACFARLTVCVCEKLSE
jgi:hypothetical protein